MNLQTHPDGRALLEPAERARLTARFCDMVCVMARLRAECPWDQKQTPESLKRYVLEEAYEVVAAIEDADWDALCEELGDHMLQVFFLSQIMSEGGHFQLVDVLDRLIDKMVHRHPHVFGDLEADEAEVVRNWETLKQAEKGRGSGLFDGFDRAQPALLESYKIGRRAARVGFDWPQPLTVLDKIEEEIGEVREAVAAEDQAAVAEELGDLLFAVSNLVRKFGLEPEACLRAANGKFIRRFQTMEALAGEDGVAFDQLDLDTQEGYWARAKARLKAEHGTR